MSVSAAMKHGYDLIFLVNIIYSTNNIKNGGVLKRNLEC